MATGATVLAGSLDHLTRDHSPLDWARTQIALAQALQALGEASADERALKANRRSPATTAPTWC